MAYLMKGVDSQLKATIKDLLTPVRDEVCEYIINLSKDEVMHIVDKYYVKTSRDATVKAGLPSIISLFLNSKDDEVCCHIISNISLSKTNVQELEHYVSDNGGINDPDWKMVHIKQWLARDTDKNLVSDNDDE